MRRTLTVLLIFGLVAGALVAPAEAAKKKKKPKRIERTVEGTYDSPNLVVLGSCPQSGGVGCVGFVTTPKDAFVAAEVTDQHGQPVFTEIWIDSDGDGSDDEMIASFCGATDEAIAIPAGAEVHFWVGWAANPDLAGCVPAIATSGSVKATFSNLP